MALAWSLASFEGVEYSPVESGSLGLLEASPESHFVVTVADLEMPAGTGEEHQAVGAYMDVGRLVGFEEDESQEQPLVQAGTPEGVVVQLAGGTAVDASAVGTGESGLHPEWDLLVGEQTGGMPLSVEAQCNQLRLQVGQGGVVWGCSWV